MHILRSKLCSIHTVLIQHARYHGFKNINNGRNSLSTILKSRQLNSRNVYRSLVGLNNNKNEDNLHCRKPSASQLIYQPLIYQLGASTSLRSYSKSSGDQAEKEKNEDSKWLTVPNLLTGFRLVISPYIGYLVLCEQFPLAFGLFCLAGVTDSVDGWIARNVKGQSSVIGSFIDPLADKVLISVLTVTLTMVNIIPVVLCGMIILRDVLLIATSSHFHYKNLTPPKTFTKFIDFENSKVKMEPTQISKYNTFLQLGLVAMSTAAPILGLVDHTLLQAYWYLVGTTTVISGLSYVVKDKSAYKIK